MNAIKISLSPVYMFGVEIGSQVLPPYCSIILRVSGPPLYIRPAVGGKGAKDPVSRAPGAKHLRNTCHWALFYSQSPVAGSQVTVTGNARNVV